jgi:cytidylate kinase
MAARVICISRAMFAGADEVAAQVGEALGFRCVDEEIIARAAERHGVDRQELANVEVRKSFLSNLFEELALGAGMAGYGHGGAIPDPGVIPVRSDSLRGLIRDSIAETAKQGDLVIVAHAASYALGPRADVLRVLVTGSAGARAARLAAREGSAHDAASARIQQSDLARADYLKRFYGVARELPEHYDLVLSTDTLAPAQAAAVIVATARAMDS